MKKILLATILGVFLLGAVPSAWGDDAGFAGWYPVGVIPGFSSGSMPEWATSAFGAGSAFKATENVFSSSLALSTTDTPSLFYSAGATGTGSISSGMNFQGFSGTMTTLYRQSSSAQGSFNFSASYGYQSQFPSAGSGAPGFGNFSFPFPW